MSVSLVKGSKVDLSKTAFDAGVKNLSNLTIGLGWDANPKKSFFGGVKTIDCDASVFVLENGKIKNNKDIIYYANKLHSSYAIKHMGDNLTGEGDGDDERIFVNLEALPPQYDNIIIVVNIYCAHTKKQDFGMIENAFVRIIDNNSGVELLKYNLSENYAGKTAMVFGKLYRYNGVWKFEAIGQGTNDDSVSELARMYR